MDALDKVKTCFICPSDKFVDDHHYDCLEGKLSPETVPMCRRCHRTYHNFGVEWFDDEFLDKAIEVENKRREIWRNNLEKFKEMGVSPYRLLRVQSPMKREDVRRSDYWNKIHGISSQPKAVKLQKQNEKQLGKQLGFAEIDALLEVK